MARPLGDRSAHTRAPTPCPPSAPRSAPRLGRGKGCLPPRPGARSGVPAAPRSGVVG